MKIILSVLLMFALVAIAAGDEPKGDEVKKEEAQEKMTANPIVLMQTNHGDVVIEVYEKDVPIHAANFLKLVDEGFYDSLTFHRVVPNFVIQGGDPDGTGMGGAPGKLEDDASSPYKHDRTTIAMARSGAGASTSQFYINLKENFFLDKQGFLIFAKVIEGMETMDKIATVKRGAQDRPVEPVIMTKVARKSAEEKAEEKPE